MCAKMTIPTRITISKVYSNSNSHKQCKNYFFFLLFVILIVCVFIAISLPLSLSSDGSNRYEKIILTNVYNLPEIRITKGVTATQTRNALCTHWDCFNIYKCGHTGHDRISVYVYPLMKFVDDNGVPATEHMSKEYHALLQAVINSKYYTANPQEACIFIPSIDTLNQDRLRLNLTSKALTSLSQ